MQDKKCKVCGVILVESQNWFLSCKRLGSYICKKCRWEKYGKYYRAYRKRHRERFRIYGKEWRKKNPEKFKARKKRHYEKHKVEIMLKQKLRRQSLLAKNFGNQCWCCEKDLTGKRDRVMHEKEGITHQEHHPEFYIRNKEKFILVCSSCHKGLHFTHDKLNLNWKEIYDRIEGSRNDRKTIAN